MVYLDVKVIPNSKKNEIVGWQGTFLKIRIQSTPEKGKANLELISFLSEVLDVKQSQIHILTGQTSKLKRLKIEGITEIKI